MQIHEVTYKPAAFSAFRRHLAAYIKDIRGAAKLRAKLMQVNNASEVAKLLKNSAR